MHFLLAMRLKLEDETEIGLQTHHSLVEAVVVSWFDDFEIFACV